MIYTAVLCDFFHQEIFMIKKRKKLILLLIALLSAVAAFLSLPAKSAKVIKKNIL